MKKIISFILIISAMLITLNIYSEAIAAGWYIMYPSVSVNPESECDGKPVVRFRIIEIAEHLFQKAE